MAHQQRWNNEKNNYPFVGGLMQFPLVNSGRVMKQFLHAIILLISIANANAQTNPVKTPYDDFIKRFNAKMDTVQWLCRYDDIAWVTSDSVAASPKEEQAKLGSEWFCYPANGTWHAVYGKMQADNFQMLYHYEVDSVNVIRRVYNSIDTSVGNSYARALVNAGKQLKTYPDTVKVRCNQYIKANADKTLSVWLLPAFTSNSIAVYGGEFYYQFDATGNNLINKSEYAQEYRGYKPDAKKEISLDYKSLDEPSLGGVFFVWYYRKYFDKIVLHTKKFSSTAFHDGPDNYYWIHAAKDQ